MKRFPGEVLAAIKKKRMFRLRAGPGSKHRILGIWAVVVEGRVFVRSWSLKPRSWWRTFLGDPQGSIFVNGEEIKVRAVQTRSERLKDLVSAAYLAKYDKPDDFQYVKDMSRRRSRDTTTELVLR